MARRLVEGRLRDLGGEFIAKSLRSSCSRDGQRQPRFWTCIDASPKGDEPGSVHVENERAINNIRTGVVENGIFAASTRTGHGVGGQSARRAILFMLPVAIRSLRRRRYSNGRAELAGRSSDAVRIEDALHRAHEPRCSAAHSRVARGSRASTAPRRVPSEMLPRCAWTAAKTSGLMAWQRSWKAAVGKMYGGFRRCSDASIAVADRCPNQHTSD